MEATAMLPDFLVPETAVRESGESNPIDCSEYLNSNLLLTLVISHAVERESLEIEILGSDDGRDWKVVPLLRVPPKNYCGTYNIPLPCIASRYIKASWRARRWGLGDQRPFFRFHIFAKSAPAFAVAGAA
jgi:hypothetical protein